MTQLNLHPPGEKVMEIGSFYLTKKDVSAGTVWELELIDKRLQILPLLQFSSEDAAIDFAKKMSKRVKKTIKSLD